MRNRFPVRIDWLPPKGGGRQEPPKGPIYSATAHFSNEDLENSFSIHLHWPDHPSLTNGMEALELSLLMPDNLPEVLDRLDQGATLIITEGPRPVAECTLLAVPVVSS